MALFDLVGPSGRSVVDGAYSSILPLNDSSAGPVMRTRPSAAQSMDSSPPSRRTVLHLPARPVRAAATLVAQAPVPQARVSPQPRSKTRMKMPSGPATANSMLAFSGKTGLLS